MPAEIEGQKVMMRFAEDLPMNFQIQIINLLQLEWVSPIVGDLHSHDYWQLFYVLDGRTSIRFPDGVYHLKAKDIVLVEPGQLHSMEQKEGKSRSFDVKFAFTAPRDVLPPGMSGVLTDRMGLLPTVENILFEVEQQKEGWRGEVAFTLFSILVRILRAMQEQSHGKQHQMVRFFDPLIEKQALRAKAYIEENYAEDLSCEQIAQDVALSPSYLTRVFQFTIGFSPMEYVTHVRLERAKELLKQEEMPIYLVSEKVGYNSPNYFTRVFKRQEGVSPSEYRQQKSL